MDAKEFEEIKDNVTFTPSELKFFVRELELRGCTEIKKCIHNARYLAKLERSYNQAMSGQVVVKTLQELEAMA